jgi:hypothetical protein
VPGGISGALDYLSPASAADVNSEDAMTVEVKDRRLARRLAAEHVARGDPLGWFERLYTLAGSDTQLTPWGDMTPNPNFTSWPEHARLDGRGKKALQIACGLGDDAEDLAAAGFQVTAFDIAPTAIQWCTTRFPESSVTYQVADLFHPPPTWSGRFDFVLEAYTLQSLPRELRSDAMAHMAACVAPGGDLLVIGRLTDDGADTDSLPWPLMRQELSAFADAGLREIRVEDYVDDEDPPVRRVRAHFRRGA